MIELSETQNKALNAVASGKYIFILFGGAMGGGKTFFGLCSLLIMCEIFPKSRWCVVRENLEKIRTTTIPSFRKLNAPGKLLSNPFEYTHPNGSTILFKGENYAVDKDLNWLKGFETCGFLFEEINECVEDTLDIAFGRIGRWECTPRPKPIILGTCNPSQGWIKKRVYDKYKNNSLPDTWLYIPSKITDNPFLTNEYKESLKNMPIFKYKVLVEGDWDLQLKLGGEFYKCFDLEKHITEATYNDTLPLHISFDENVNPYLPLGIFQIVGKKIICIDEIAGVNPNNTIKSVSKEFIRKYGNHKSGLFIYGDATSRRADVKLEKGYDFFRLIMDELKDFKPQLRIANSNPSVVMRGNFINTILESEFDGISFEINTNCKLMINDFTNLKEAEDGTKNKEMETDPKTKVRYQKYGHFTDLTDYLICYAFAQSYQKFQTPGINRIPTVGKNLAKNNF